MKTSFVREESDYPFESGHVCSYVNIRALCFLLLCSSKTKKTVRCFFFLWSTVISTFNHVWLLCREWFWMPWNEWSLIGFAEITEDFNSRMGKRSFLSIVIKLGTRCFSLSQDYKPSICFFLAGFILLHLDISGWNIKSSRLITCCCSSNLSSW